MNEEMLRFLMMSVFISAVLAIAAISGELSSYSISEPFEDYYPSVEFNNVSELLDRMPLGNRVSLSGTVSLLEEDYISKKGYEYQQFFITDGSTEVKVFCSKRGGGVEISQGDKVFLSGKLQKYYDTLEIYTDCSNIDILE